MTRCVKLVLFLSLGVLAGRRAFAEDGSLTARLDREFARLASNDPAERDSSVEAIVKEGSAAEAAVKARMAVEKDPESRGRLEMVLQRIHDAVLSSRRWEPLWTLEPLESPAREAAISPDGKRFATAGPDGHVRVYDATKMELLQDFDTGSPVAGRGLLFDAEGRTIFIGRDYLHPPVMLAFTIADGTPVAGLELEKVGFDRFEIWKDAEDRRVAYRQDPEGGTGGFLGVSSGTKWISAPSRLGTILREDGHEIRVFDPGSRQIGTSSQLVIQEGDYASPQTLIERKLDVDNPPLSTLYFALSPDTHAVALIREKKCRIVDISTGEEGEPFGDGLIAVLAARDGWILLGGDKSIQCWSSGKQSWSVKPEHLHPSGFALTDSLFAFRFPNDEPAGEFENGLEVRSMKDGALVTTFPAAELRGPWKNGAFAVSLPGGESALFSGGREVCRVKTPIWKTQSWSKAQAADSSLLVVTDEGTLLFDLGTGRSRGPAPLHHDRIHRLEFLEQGLFAAGDTEEAFFAAGGKAFRRYPVEKRLVGTGRAPEREVIEGRGALTGTADGRLTAWAEGHTVHIRREKEGGQEAFDVLLEGKCYDTDYAIVQHLVFSADGSRMAITNTDANDVEVWDLDARRRLFTIKDETPVHPSPIFLADGTLALLQEEQKTGKMQYFPWLVLYDREGIETRRVEWMARTLLAGRLGVEYTAGGYHCLDLLDPKRDVVFEEFPHSDPSLIPFLVGGARGLILARFGGAPRVTSAVRLLNLGSARSADLDDIDYAGETIASSLPDGSALLLTTKGVAILRPLDWAPVGVKIEIQGSALAVSPDGKRVAIAKGSRVTVYELR